MKIFIIESSSGEHEQHWTHVAGVYETREEAEQAIRNRPNAWEECEIVEATLGQWIPA